MKVIEISWQERLERKKGVLRQIPDEALEVLVETFQSGRLYDADPAKMAYNVAQFELVEYIKQMRVLDGDE